MVEIFQVSNPSELANRLVISEMTTYKPFLDQEIPVYGFLFV